MRNMWIYRETRALLHSSYSSLFQVGFRVFRVGFRVFRVGFRVFRVGSACSGWGSGFYRHPWLIANFLPRQHIKKHEMFYKIWPLTFIYDPPLFNMTLDFFVWPSTIYICFSNFYPRLLTLDIIPTTLEFPSSTLDPRQKPKLLLAIWMMILLPN
jgi:hypothetical protein